MKQEENTPQIKICGITRKEEAAFLNEAKVDYAGFVFFEKSKRNITFEEAKAIVPLLDAKIKKVAVFVSPTLEEVRKAEEIGMDVIQIHGTMKEEICKKSRHPIWRAWNIKKHSEEEKQALFTLLSENINEKNEEGGLQGIVVDGAEYGAGKTFDWNDKDALLRIREKLGTQNFILAGGLHAGNVREGISIFKPDIVDVSSGVENENGIGKNREKILEFVGKVRTHE